MDIPITSSILSAVSHSDDLPYDLNIYCPTLGCNYSAFETLAICSSCETEEVQISDFGCKIELAWSNCTECDALQPSLAFSSWDEARENIRENIYKSCFFDLNATCIYEKTKDSDDPLSLTLSVHKGMILGEDQSCNGRLESAQFELLQTVTQPGDVGIEETSFMQHTVGFWDDNTTETMIISSSSDAFLKEKYLSFCNSLYPNYHEWKDHETAILVSNCFTSTTDLETWKENTIESIEKLGSITGRVTTCTLKFCAKKYDNVRVGDHQSWGEDGQSLPLSSRPTERYPMEEDMRRFCVDGDPSCPYSWSRDSRRELLRSIAAGLGSYQFALALNLPISGPSTPDKFSRLFDRIAKGASKVLQSPLNPAATNVTGIAEGPEIFVKVRWEWFAFPVFVALVGVVFLLATVVRSRGEARLFKNSILAAFLFELEGWAAEGRRVDGRDGRQTGEDVLRVSQGIVGSIRTDDTVDLKFKRE